MFRRKRKIKSDVGKHKFCPVCGIKLELYDTYCTKCGYSFAERHKKRRKKFKWKNIIFIIIVLIIFYISIRYFNGQSIIPVSMEDALNFTIKPKG